MMHPKLRWVMFTAALGVVACHGDPTDSLRNGAKQLRASPGSVFVSQGDSVAIVTELLDEQGNRLSATFSATSSDPNQLPVDLDHSFIPVYDAENHLIPPTDATRSRFFVKGVGLARGALTITSGGLIQTVPVVSIPSAAGTIFNVGVLSTTTPALGDTVTLTVPAPWKLTPTATVASTQNPAPPIVTVGVSADSSSIRFIPGPNIDSTVIVSPAALPYAPSNDPNAPPLNNFTLNSTQFLVTPSLTTATVSFSPGAPASGDTVTATALGLFRWLPTATITFGGSAVIPVAVSADSLQLTFVPIPGSPSGPAVVTDIVLSFLPAGPLTLPTTGSLTIPAPLAGTGAFATAPALTVPGPGGTTAVFDAGTMSPVAECNNDLGGDCRIYKFTVGASTTLTFTATWGSTTDIGVYFYDATQSILGAFGCDNGGNGSGGQPETCSHTFAAGTYFAVLDDFGPFYAPPEPPPTWVELHIAQ